MDLDAADTAFVESLIPDGAVVSGLVAVVTFMQPETGLNEWKVYCDVDMPVSSTLGFLELAKLEVIARSNTGLPIRHPDDDD